MPRHVTHFGEPVTYIFRDGGKRKFNAIIDRNPPAYYGDSGEVILPEFVVRFPNDCSCGVLASEIDKLDKIELLAELGDVQTETKTVEKLVSQGGGVCTVHVQ